MEKKKSKVKFIVLGVVAVIIIGIVVVSNLMMKNVSYTKEEKVENRSISTYYNFNGSISASETQKVVAEAPLQIKTVHVKEGDTVKKGDKLFTVTADQTITSKVNGTITALPAKTDAICISGEHLATISNLDTLQVDLKVDEYDINCLELDKEVTVHINSLAVSLSGKVKYVSKEAETEQATVYFPVTVAIENKDNLRVGMSCEVTALNQTSDSALSITMEALKFDTDNKAYVDKKGPNGAAVKTYVVTGINDGNYVEIKEGLSQDDTILVPILSQLTSNV